MDKKIIIIAGPNGAGKTSFARSFLPKEAQCLRFINADLIAAGLSPFAPEVAAIKAGRVMLEEIAACVRREESFAFETTLSSSSAASDVYKRQLPLMWLPSKQDASCWKKLPPVCDVKKVSHLKPPYPVLVI